MKPKVIVPFLLLFAVIPSDAVTISQWTFETRPPADLNNSMTSPSAAADSGTGTASGFHASGATDWLTPPGNGSANSWSANTWAENDYFQFRLSTIGFVDIGVCFDQTSSGTGPRDFKLAYSIDGSSFTDFQNYTVSAVSWSASSAAATSSYMFDLSSVTAIEDAASVYFRLINRNTASANGGTIGSGGTDRIDNFIVSGAVKPATVPDSSPGIAGWGCLLMLLALSQQRVAQRLVACRT